MRIIKKMEVEKGNSALNIVVPVKNEGDNVRTLVSNLKEKNIDFNSLYFIYDIDDDATIPVIVDLQKTDSRICSSKNCFGPGIVNALRWGFSLESQGAIVVLMGDNSDDLSVIPKMLELWHAGAKIVSPSRYMAGGIQNGGPLLKKTLSKLAGVSLRVMGFPTSDPTNNFKLYDAVWLSNIELESKGGFEVALELCYKAFKGGQKISQLPAEWTDRTSGESKFNLMKWLPHYLYWYFKTIRILLRPEFRLRNRR